MRFQLETGGEANLIRTYSPGHIVVNQNDYSGSVVVLPGHILTDWPPQTFEDLLPEHFTAINALAPELLILGTGARQRFPRADLLASLVSARIGWEVMDTGAACRTYNILMSEGRNVAAALLRIE